MRPAYLNSTLLTFLFLRFFQFDLVSRYQDVSNLDSIEAKDDGGRI